MGAKYNKLAQKHIDFIAKQHIFFVATATKDSYINLSPKDNNSLHIVNSNKILWLNLTGSGNETAAHLQEDGRMTIMFCAFSGNPNIVRIYGRAKTINRDNDNWDKYLKLFSNKIGARQIIILDIKMVANSCGFGVPKYDFVSYRDELNNWANKKGTSGIKKYQDEKNSVSINNKKIKIYE